MKLACPGCGATIDAKDLDAARSLARCSYCRSVVDLSGRDGPGGRLPARERPEVPLPPSVRVTARGSELEIALRWFSFVAFFLAFFCIVWFGFLAFWYSRAMDGPDTPSLFFYFPLLHVAAGLGIAYKTAATFLNTTTVTASRSRLAVRHGPVPWPGNRDLATRDIAQLFCRQKVSHGKNGTTITYEVHALLRTGKREKLVSGIAEDQALYLERRLERHLGLADAAVAGEHAG